MTDEPLFRHAVLIHVEHMRQAAESRLAAQARRSSRRSSPPLVTRRPGFRRRLATALHHLADTIDTPPSRPLAT
ncbi:hypothetical protein [Thermoactinospora rubra]|uniref:hypothetical protein n=1 Tax=Thermoactinospora rubra TaxID=1088767 RepID=UPI000A1096A4|nr:hypothetical protein [Thermoactinospora rubra]